MTSFHNIHGVILKKTLYKDSDAILQILTQEQGKMSFYARGIKKAQSKIGALLQVGNVIELEVIQGKGNMANIKNAKTIFIPEIPHYESLRVFQRSLEITQHICQEAHELPHIFHTLSQFIIEFTHTNSELLSFAYEYKLLKHLGFIGDAKTCSKCHEPLAACEHFFLPERGIICNICSSEFPYLSKLPLSIIKILIFFQNDSFKNIKKLQISEEEYKVLQFFIITLRKQFIHKTLKTEG